MGYQEAIKQCHPIKEFWNM